MKAKGSKHGPDRFGPHLNPANVSIIKHFVEQKLGLNTDFDVLGIRVAELVGAGGEG